MSRRTDRPAVTHASTTPPALNNLCEALENAINAKLSTRISNAKLPTRITFLDEKFGPIRKFCQLISKQKSLNANLCFTVTSSLKAAITELHSLGVEKEINVFVAEHFIFLRDEKFTDYFHVESDGFFYDDETEIVLALKKSLPIAPMAASSSIAKLLAVNPNLTVHTAPNDQQRVVFLETPMTEMPGRPQQTPPHAYATASPQNRANLRGPAVRDPQQTYSNTSSSYQNPARCIGNYTPPQVPALKPRVPQVPPPAHQSKYVMRSTTPPSTSVDIIGGGQQNPGGPSFFTTPPTLVDLTSDGQQNRLASLTPASTSAGVIGGAGPQNSVLPSSDLLLSGYAFK